MGRHPSRVKLLLTNLLVIGALLSSGCNKTDVNMTLAKLVGFKVAEQKFEVKSQRWQQALFTAKHTGTLWTFIESNTNAAIRVAVVNEEEYEKLTSSNNTHSIWNTHTAAGNFVEAVVEAGKKYYLVVDSNKNNPAKAADLSVQSFFFNDR